MAPRPVANQRFRQRKLSTRLALQVIKGEKELETLEGDQQSAPKVETGVEKHEETEHHLQAAISASKAAAVGGNVAQVYIPTPETAQSSIPYSQLYQLKFAQPATYIRSSSTVEDVCGCPYNMTEEDDAFLKEFNEKLAQAKSASTQCSEDQFEEAMNLFEETSKLQQPFSSVGEPPPVLSWEDMENAFDENLDEPVRTFAKEMYEHWKACREKNGNVAIHPGLKLKIMDSTNDTDDNDPYVCFRRREVRQIRKTRGRDAQSVEKLKKLRRELEEARQIVALVRQREVTKKEQLAVEKQLFEQRSALRQCKLTLGEPYCQGDEDLLINQKPPKKRPPQVITQPGAIGQQRPVQRPDGQAAEKDLILLEDLLIQKDREVLREIAAKKVQHARWNEGYVDMTNYPLTPPPTGELDSNFVPAFTEYLPTPPASISQGSEHQGDPRKNTIDMLQNVKEDSPLPVRFIPSISDKSPTREQPSYRRRIGRGGRMMIDRRGNRVKDKKEVNRDILDRWKYDMDDENMEDTTMVDPFDIQSMRYRAAISHAQGQTIRRAQVDASSGGNVPRVQFPGHARSVSKDTNANA
ncbi:Enhancer of polycomb-like protein 1 [Thelotrema lepadinum]|nr:Enhancer of polycomb-like protein 1 [Thelotrema lepadinum]